ncbi:hypothetical protein ABFX02_04G114100 [Erythranthe guttata]
MKMSLKLSLFLSFFLVFHINANNAFNITQILGQYPDFSSFNTYLTQANLAGDINSRQTITVLVVENSNTSPLSGLSPDALKKILSVHVVLDYFDAPKIQKLSNTSTTVTTLFQASGLARGQQGFLNITHATADSISFKSAVAGATTVSSLVKSVVSQPYNISVLQVSNVIVPPEPTNSTSNNSTSSSPPPSTAPSTAPSASKTPPPPPPPTTVSPSKSPSAAPPTSSPVPSASDAPTEAATPAAATPGSAPTAADAPAADAPAADAPAAATADAPAADAPPSDHPSADGTTLKIGVCVFFTLVLSTICLASSV